MSRELGLVLFLIRNLEHGGAERQLCTLASLLKRSGIPVKVATFYDPGPLERELKRADVPVVSLRKGGRWDVLPFAARFARLLMQERPAVLHTYLTNANLLGALFKPLLRGGRLVWGIRASNVDLSRYDWLAMVIDKIERRMTKQPGRIIINSERGRDHYLQRGFPEDKVVVIHNGIDTVRFHYDAQGRSRVRGEWGVSAHEFLVGLVARFDPMKDHFTFLEAATHLLRKYSHCRFACIGSGNAAVACQIKKVAKGLNIAERVIWAGLRDDMPAIYSAFDVACSSSSFGEGFSNSVAEAMACERVCVVTDVGDAPHIVAETGKVVPPRDYLALATAIEHVLELDQTRRESLGRLARDRIEARFDVGFLMDRTLAVLNPQ